MTLNSKKTMKSEKPNLPLIRASDELTVEEMARMWNALTGKYFPPKSAVRCQKKIDASKSQSASTQKASHAKEIHE